MKIRLGLVAALLLGISSLTRAQPPATQPQRPAGELFTVSLAESVKLEMAWIPPGTVALGGIRNDFTRPFSRQTDAVITRGYWIGKYELTQSQWTAVMRNSIQDMYAVYVAASTQVIEFSPTLGRYDPTGEGPEYPMYAVPWTWAMRFCEKLTEAERAAGRLPAGYEFTLPTEAEAVHASRAGAKTAYFLGDTQADLEKAGWGRFTTGSGSRNPLHPVGDKAANAWGLYDTIGNVGEWCYDEMPGPGTRLSYPLGTVTDFAGYAVGSDRHVVTGASAATVARGPLQMESYRTTGADTILGTADGFRYTGFRVALTEAPRPKRTPAPVPGS